jgi:hypothetical protein
MTFTVSLFFVLSLRGGHFSFQVVVKLFYISYKLLSVIDYRVVRSLYRFEAQAGMVSIVGEERTYLSSFRQGIINYKFN